MLNSYFKILLVTLSHLNLTKDPGCGKSKNYYSSLANEEIKA
jgi:hypothetical protein